MFELRDLAVNYSGSYAVQGVDMLIRKNEITALIGPSGCGKTTVLRCLNRTNDLIQGAKVEGKVLYHGIDLYGPKVEPVEVRRRIGMVFQKPNPFPKSIYDNIAFGPRVGGFKGNMDELVETVAATRGALGRGEEQPQGLGHGALGRSAAAPVHRPLHRGGARRHPDGRALLRARSGLDSQDRGAHATSWCPSTRSSS